jgi:hypothetical protein
MKYQVETGARRFRCYHIGMHTYLAKVEAEGRFHKVTGSDIQGLPWRAEDLVNQRGAPFVLVVGRLLYPAASPAASYDKPRTPLPGQLCHHRRTCVARLRAMGMQLSARLRSASCSYMSPDCPTANVVWIVRWSTLLPMVRWRRRIGCSGVRVASTGFEIEASC